MTLQTIPETLHQDVNRIRQMRGLSPLSAEDFHRALHDAYAEFQSGECSLGYAAAQLGVSQVDFIALLDQLGWKVTNI